MLTEKSKMEILFLSLADGLLTLETSLDTCKSRVRSLQANVADMIELKSSTASGLESYDVSYLHSLQTRLSIFLDSIELCLLFPESMREDLSNKSDGR